MLSLAGPASRPSTLAQWFSIPGILAALGGDVQVPTVDGYAKLRLDAGTQTGKVYRLRGKGLPSVEGYGHGDLHVQILVEVPAKLNSKQRKAVKDLVDGGYDGNYPGQKRMAELAERFFERKAKIGEKKD